MASWTRRASVGSLGIERSVEYLVIASDMGCVSGTVRDTKARPPDQPATAGWPLRASPPRPACSHALRAGTRGIAPRAGRRRRQIQSPAGTGGGPAAVGGLI